METSSPDQPITQHASHTSEHTNFAVKEKIQHSLAYYREHPDQIERRLNQLDKEWNVERALQAKASGLILAGSTLGLLSSRKFFALPVLAGAFLLQHALQGWCPPMGLLRRMGFRTSAEIEEERRALEEIRTRH